MLRKFVLILVAVVMVCFGATGCKKTLEGTDKVLVSSSAAAFTVLMSQKHPDVYPVFVQYVYKIQEGIADNYNVVPVISLLAARLAERKDLDPEIFGTLQIFMDSIEYSADGRVSDNGKATIDTIMAGISRGILIVEGRKVH